MHSKKFKEIIQNTPQIVAVFTIERMRPWIAQYGLTKEDVFYYAGNGTFIKTDTYNRFSLPISSMKFRAYMTWNGKRLGLFPN